MLRQQSNQALVRGTIHGTFTHENGEIAGVIRGYQWALFRARLYSHGDSHKSNLPNWLST
jgi:hypothetical protein